MTKSAQDAGAGIRGMPAMCSGWPHLSPELGADLIATLAHVQAHHLSGHAAELRPGVPAATANLRAGLRSCTAGTAASSEGRSARALQAHGTARSAACFTGFDLRRYNACFHKQCP